MVKKQKATKKKILSHHRHTGRLIHKRHTSYPVLALMLLIVSAVLGYVTIQVKAADVSVNAVIYGPPPPSPAVILSPQQNEHFTATPITVSGTCPFGFYIKLFRNTVFSGSATCQPDGTFSLQTDLFAGRNDLAARIYNLGNQEGPAPTIVTVYYDVPEPVTPPTTPSNPATPSTPPPSQPHVDQPFFITTDYFFKAANEGDEIVWDFGIVGGQKEYNAEIDWGDGNSSSIKEINTDQFTAKHIYQKGKSPREYYTVTITLTDAEDKTTTLEVFVILNSQLDTAEAGSGAGTGLPGSSPNGTTSTTVNKPLEALKKAITVAVPTVVLTSLLTTSFWIGEWKAASMAGKHLPIRKIIFHKWR